MPLVIFRYFSVHFFKKKTCRLDVLKIADANCGSTFLIQTSTIAP